VYLPYSSDLFFESFQKRSQLLILGVLKQCVFILEQNDYKIIIN